MTVLLNEGKVSGTLIESSAGVLYVGTGINVVSSPQGLPYKTACIADDAGTGAVDLALPARRLIDNWQAHYGRWRAGGFGTLKGSYNECLSLRGKLVRVSLDRERGEFAEGVCLGVDG